MALSPELQDQLAAELAKDRGKPFKEEFKRTTNVERRILDQHGVEGAKFLLGRKGLSCEWDESCPWRLDDAPFTEQLVRALGPLVEWLPELSRALRQRGRHLLTARQDGKWRLVYVAERALYDGRPYWNALVGAAPNASPQLSERLRQRGWVVPGQLRLLCSVHDGFGPYGDEGIAPVAELTDLAEMLDPIAAKQGTSPDGYSFGDLLEFFPDGAGNAQCFHRRKPGDDNPPTVDWDHETWQLSGPESFFEFVDRRLAGCILDEE